MKTYAIWKDHKVIGYIDLSEDQASILNKNKETGLYFGFDKITNPEHYELLDKFLDIEERKEKAIHGTEEYILLSNEYKKLFDELETIVNQ